MFCFGLKPAFGGNKIGDAAALHILLKIAVNEREASVKLAISVVLYVFCCLRSTKISHQATSDSPESNDMRLQFKTVETSHV